MNETSVLCPKCGNDQEVGYDTDGPKVLDAWLINDDSGMECVECKADIPSDLVYEAASLAHAEALDDYDPTDAELTIYNGPQ